MSRRLALLAGSITALVAAVMATLRGRKPGTGRKGGKGRAARAGGGGSRARATPPVARQEPQAAAAAASSTESAPSPPSAEPRAADDLRAIKGIGSAIAERLREAGVDSVEQLAAWSPGDIQEMAERIKVKPERIVREDWVGQARSVTRGGSHS